MKPFSYADIAGIIDIKFHSLAASSKRKIVEEIQKF
jgi:hypothetical protein